MPTEVCMHLAEVSTTDALTYINVIACRYFHYLCLGVSIPTTVHPSQANAILLGLYRIVDLTIRPNKNNL